MGSLRSEGRPFSAASREERDINFSGYVLADGGWMLGPGHTWATQGAYLHKQTHTRTCVRIHRYRCIHVYMYLHICVHIHIHVHLHLHIHMQI